MNKIGLHRLDFFGIITLKYILLDSVLITSYHYAYRIASYKDLQYYVQRNIKTCYSFDSEEQEWH